MFKEYFVFVCVNSCKVVKDSFSLAGTGMNVLSGSDSCFLAVKYTKFLSALKLYVISQYFFTEKGTELFFCYFFLNS